MMRGRVVSKPRAEGGQGGLAGSPDVRGAASGQPPGEVGGTTFDPHRRRLSIERWGGIAVSGSDLECFFPGVTAKPEDIDYQLIEQGRREVREVCGAEYIGVGSPVAAQCARRPTARALWPTWDKMCRPVQPGSALGADSSLSLACASLARKYRWPSVIQPRCLDRSAATRSVVTGGHREVHVQPG